MTKNEQEKTKEKKLLQGSLAILELPKPRNLSFLLPAMEVISGYVKNQPPIKTKKQITNIYRFEKTMKIIWFLGIVYPVNCCYGSLQEGRYNLIGTGRLVMSWPTNTPAQKELPSPIGFTISQ